MDGLACSCCCTVLAFFLLPYSAPSSGRTRGSCLISTALLWWWMDRQPDGRTELRTDWPHAGDHVRLGQLHYDGPAAQLVTRVAWVPVVQTRISIDERVAAPANPLRHTCTVFDCGHILCWNWMKRQRQANIRVRKFTFNMSNAWQPFVFVLQTFITLLFF